MVRSTAPNQFFASKMPNDLDPKLRELEAQLRRLKPFRRDGRRQSADSRRLRRIVAAVITTAATVLILVCLYPQPPVLPPVFQPIPESVLVATTDPLPSAVCRLPSPSMRQQLTELLDEMTVADPIAEKQPIYPVVEIAVCAEGVRRQELGDRSLEAGVRRWEHTRWQMEDLTMF